MRWLFFAFLLIVSVISAVSSLGLPDEIIINSKDWMDVCSGMNFARIHRLDGYFLTDETQGTLVISMLEGKNVMVIQPKEDIVFPNYAARLEQGGFTTDVVTGYDNLNLELARDEENAAEGYIIIDPRYPYNFISVAPYASLKKYYVIFADKENIDDVLEVLEDGDKIIVYGYVDREVSDALLRFDPVIINEGDKYSNNIEIMKMFEKESETKQVVFTSGNFIEPQFFLENNPIALISAARVPEKTVEYLRDAGIRYGMVVGNELVTSATNIKDRTGMKIMVKFAKGVNQVQYALDTVALPEPDFRPKIMDAVYNQFSKELMVTIENTGTSPVMVLPSYVIYDGNETTRTIESKEVLFISGKGIATQSFQADFEGYRIPMVEASMLYGEDRNSLDRLIKEFAVVDITTFEDNSEIDIIDAYYDKNIKRFIIDIKNTGQDDVYATAIIKDILINNRIESVGTDDIIKIKPESTGKIKIKADLSAADIEDNKNLKAEVKYGLKKNLLTKKYQKDFEFVAVSKINNIVYAVAAIAAIIVLFMILGRRKKKKKKHSKKSSGVKRRVPPPPKHMKQ